MKKWFLLYRVQIEGAGVPVDKAVVFSSPIFPHPAIAPLSPWYSTVAWAQLAADFLFIKWCEVGGELRIYKTLFYYLCLGEFWPTEQAGEGERTETRPA